MSPNQNKTVRTPEHATSRAERLDVQLCALVARRYVPNGGDLVMRHLRHRNPSSGWINPSLQSLCQFERRTRLNESVHLLGFLTGSACIERLPLANVGLAPEQTFNGAPLNQPWKLAFKADEAEEC